MSRSQAGRNDDTARLAADRLEELRAHVRLLAEPADDDGILSSISEALLRLTGAVSVQIERYLGNGDALLVASAGSPAAAAGFDPEGAGRLVIAVGGRSERLGNLILHRRQPAPAVEADNVQRISDLATLAALALRRIALHDELQRSRAEGRRIVEDKYRLIRGVADEVRERLGVATEYVRLLDTEGELNEREERYIDRSRQAIQAVIGVINDLAHLARLDTGRVALRPETVNIGTLVRGMVRDFQLSFATIGFEFDVSVPELPGIETDIDAVRQILDNLLSNAVRYTPVGGRITISAEIRPSLRRTGPARFVCVAVTDTGPGIGDEEQIFEEVYRVGRRGMRPGFRLAISRRMARLLGGDLTLTTGAGQGSTFTLWLPDAPPATPPGYSDLKEEAGSGAR